MQAYVRRNGVTISEMLSVTMPNRLRPKVETSVQGIDVETKQMGLLKKGSLAFYVNYIDGDPTHEELKLAIDTESEDLYEFSNGVSVETAYGQVEWFNYDVSPVDGVTRMQVNVLLVPDPLLLQEDGSSILTEDDEELEIGF